MTAGITTLAVRPQAAPRKLRFRSSCWRMGTPPPLRWVAERASQRAAAGAGLDRPVVRRPTSDAAIGIDYSAAAMPPIVYLPGAGGTVTFWEPVAERLTNAGLGPAVRF